MILVVQFDYVYNENDYGCVFVKKSNLGHIDVEAALEDLISAVKDAPLVNIPRVCEFITQDVYERNSKENVMVMLIFQKKAKKI